MTSPITSASASTSRNNNDQDLYAQTPTVKRASPREATAITRLSEQHHLVETNWMFWKEPILRILRLCEVEDFVTGTVNRPDDKNSEDGKNWSFNDNYAQVVIVNNITASEMVHVGQCKTAKNIWNNLEAVHESK